MKTLTSETHPLRVDWIEDFEGGRLGLTFAPGKHQVSEKSGGRWARDLEADLARLRAHWRADLLVCLLEDDELPRLRIPALVERAEAHGLRVLRLPIRDGGVPADAGAVARLVDAILGAVRAGERVVIHCAGGLGRTGTIAGCCLVAAGVEPGRALEVLRSTRGAKCPENEAQKHYVRAFESEALRPEAARYARLTQALTRPGGAIPGEMAAALFEIAEVQRPYESGGRLLPGLPAGVPTYGRVRDGVGRVLELLDGVGIDGRQGSAAGGQLDGLLSEDAVGRLAGLRAGLRGLRSLLDLEGHPLFVPRAQSEHWIPLMEAFERCADVEITHNLLPPIHGADCGPRNVALYGAHNWLRQGFGDVPGMTARQVVSRAATKLFALARFGGALATAARTLRTPPHGDHVRDASGADALATAEDLGHVLASAARMRAAQLEYALATTR